MVESNDSGDLSIEELKSVSGGSSPSKKTKPKKSLVKIKAAVKVTADTVDKLDEYKKG